MVHKHSLVAVVKVAGKILRETQIEGETVVILPFGSEYSISLKNLSTQRAVANITVDGKTVIDGLLVNANSEANIERFFEGNLNDGHRLKFIEKTAQISEHRGDRIDDGILRIEYKFEKKVIKHEVIHEHDHYHHHHDHHDHYHWPTVPWYRPSIRFSSSLNTLSRDSDEGNYSSDIRSMSFGGGARGQSIGDPISGPIGPPQAGAESYASLNMPDQAASFQFCDTGKDGITVNGAHSSQSFFETTIGELESTSYVIIIKLRGTDSSSEPVVRPLTTREKIHCPTCGMSNPSFNSYCKGCGTYLR